MAVFNLVSRATLRSPRVLASMARAALPVPATVRQPVLSLSALPALVLNVNENQSKSSLLPLVAAAGVFGMLTQSYEPSYCAGKRKKNGSDQVDDMYEVDHIKARKLEKGVPKYLIHWKGYTDKDDTWEGLENLARSPLPVGEVHAPAVGRVAWYQLGSTSLGHCNLVGSWMLQVLS